MTTLHTEAAESSDAGKSEILQRLEGSSIGTDLTEGEGK